MTTGTATLYGRFETHDHVGASGRDASSVREVASDAGVADRDPGVARGAGIGVGAGVGEHRPQDRGELGVELERDDVVPGVEQRERERAEAGTDLEHRVSGGSSARATMRRAVFGSARKFWPRLFFGRSPCSARSAWTVAGVSIAIAVDATGWVSAASGSSHAPLRPVQDVVRTSPRVPTEVGVDAHARR